MITQWCPWADVFPYAQFVGADGQLWTVLPSHPLFPRLVTRAGAGTWSLPVDRFAYVALVIPTPEDAIATLARTFNLEMIGEQVTSQFWHCPAVVTHWQLARHLRDFHAHPIASLGAMSEYETHRLHNGYHQQVVRYPLPVAHIHTPEVSS